jgi:hypothetical protein
MDLKTFSPSFADLLMRMYVTYDLPQTVTPESKSEPLIRGAKEINLAGALIKWEVGEFENASGAKSYGVRLEYTDPVIGPASELVEVPANAKNVQVHPEFLPAEYHPALKTAA